MGAEGTWTRRFWRQLSTGIRSRQLPSGLSHRSLSGLSSTSHVDLQQVVKSVFINLTPKLPHSRPNFTISHFSLCAVLPEVSITDIRIINFLLLKVETSSLGWHYEVPGGSPSETFLKSMGLFSSHIAFIFPILFIHSFIDLLCICEMWRACWPLWEGLRSVEASQTWSPPTKALDFHLDSLVAS